jgi:Na+/H+ antiporter NhaD/arsenite permease-like protein
LSSPASFAELLEGPALGLVWGTPFLGLLITIAVAQTASPARWERHYGTLTGLWIIAAVIPLIARFGTNGLMALERLILLEYAPFALSILALYVIAGGIHIRSRMSGHPAENALLLALGTLASGVLGTPGSTLLFLPVLLKSNRWRRYKAHSVVFLIFVVCNIGGAFSPIGPPLLIGYLKGVPFLWTVRMMLLPTAFVSAILIAGYVALDSMLLFRLEDPEARASHKQQHDVIRLEGAINLLLLCGAIGLQIFCGSWRTDAAIPLGGLTVPAPDLLRLFGLSALAAASLALTPKGIRAANEFSWLPMKEVVVVFAGIFATILPVLAILAAGVNGALGGLIRMVTGTDGQPINWAYFTASGLLSSFLDNAPTFLLFFNAAGGDPVALTGPNAATLVAISAGAAFWGGLTYVGNAPNFVVRTMSEQRGVRMPTFIAYLAWSAAILLPTFALTAWVFFG